MTVDQWSIDQSANATIVDATYGEISFAESMVPASLNDSARVLMTHFKAWYTGMYPYSSISTDATLDIDDANKLVSVDASASARTVTLPAASTNKGLLYTVEKGDVGANAVTIVPNGTDTINGDASKALDTQFQSVALLSNGVDEWETVRSNKNGKDIFAHFYAASGTYTNITVGARNTWTKVNLDTTKYNAGGGTFSSSTYKAPFYGRYWVTGSVIVRWLASVEIQRYHLGVSTDGGATVELATVITNDYQSSPAWRAAVGFSGFVNVDSTAGLQLMYMHCASTSGNLNYATSAGLTLSGGTFMSFIRL